ncbi:hypothetical protein [Mammaliicoccus vitulinus]|uniref:DUF7841 family protein n=1 Tax=Mammaliicoccus vitulinus TaxID=71237 RepID=UPI00248C236B|nr:hypothetical protein [Mammaliicoccus vitulinus]
MNRYLLDVLMQRTDGRNPYGSRGGYVDSYGSSRRDRSYDDEYRDGMNRMDRMDRYDRNYESREYRDEYSRRDGHYSELEDMKYLKNRTIRKWSRDVGEHFQMEKIMPMLEKEDIRFETKDYTKEEFIMTMNMLYSDYNKILGDDPTVYIKMAKCFLEDKDSVVNGGEKLASYYYAMIYDGQE